MNEEYQEIDLLKLFRVVLSKWWLILLLMVVAAGSAYYYTDNYVTPIYEAKATLFIGKENTDSLTGLNLNDLRVENQLIVDYRELIKTRLVTEEVIDELALLASPGDLVTNLSISSIDESRFMYITYTDHIPGRAAEITNKLSDVMAEKASEIIGVQYVKVVDAALEPTKPISPSIMKNTAIAGVLGAMIAMGIIFLMMMLDNKIHDEEDIEAILGMPVLGMIPEFEGKERRA